MYLMFLLAHTHVLEINTILIYIYNNLNKQKTLIQQTFSVLVQLHEIPSQTHFLIMNTYQAAVHFSQKLNVTSGFFFWCFFVKQINYWQKSKTMLEKSN